MYVYVLEDSKGKQYVGITTDLERRFNIHKNGHVFTTSKMDLVSLEIRHYWNVPSYSYASRLERYLHTVHKDVTSDIIIDCPLWCKTLEEAAKIQKLTNYEHWRDTKIWNIPNQEI